MKFDLMEIEKNLPTTYQNMLSKISESWPVLKKAKRNFNKSQSQFMNNMLTLSQPTELRSLRQILAEVNNSKMALDEAYFGLKKKKIEIKQKHRELGIEKDDLKCELIKIEIMELESQISNSLEYVEGAIRRVASYTDQYNTILKFLGKENFSEEDFENDEERYHIMKAFEQGLCAARSHGGVIDEGNHIYFYQIGISGTAAQIEVSNFLEDEGFIVNAGKMPDHSHTWEWMHKMADKYAGCARKFSELKHMKLLDKDSLHQEENQCY